MWSRARSLQHALDARRLPQGRRSPPEIRWELIAVMTRTVSQTSSTRTLARRCDHQLFTRKRDGQLDGGNTAGHNLHAGLTNQAARIVTNRMRDSPLH